jgi:succinyl-CoA synthetase alpha subunit
VDNEADAAHWIKADGNRKPVVGFIAELLLQQVVQWDMQVHVGGTDDTAEAKKQIMRECGITLWILQLNW